MLGDTHVPIPCPSANSAIVIREHNNSMSQVHLGYGEITQIEVNRAIILDNLFDIIATACRTLLDPALADNGLTTA